MGQAYTNLGGTGSRAAASSAGPIVPSTNATITGDMTNLLDGDFSTNTNHSMFFSSNVSNTGLYFQFDMDFRPGGSVVDKVKLYMNSSTSQGDWKVQGSNNSWSTSTDITGGAFTWNTATQEVVLTNSTAYTSYRIIGTGGNTNNGPWIEEIEFSIDGNTNERGARTGAITVTSDITFGGPNSPPELVNGTETGADGVWASSQAVTGQDIIFDFLGISTIVKALVWQTDHNSDAWGSWNVDGWNGSSWTNITNITIGGVGGSLNHDIAQLFSFSNTIGYTKYRLHGTSGTTAGAADWQNEAQFVIAGATPRTKSRCVVIH